MTKAELRKQAKSIIKEADKSYFASANKAITEKVLGSEKYKNSSVIFIYVSTESEPDTINIIESALAEGKKVCVPKCISKSEMEAVVIESLDELVEGRYGLKEPADTEKAIDIAEIDLAVIPCVAASKENKRLGHGAGYYDRFLETTKAFKMCLCFEKLIFDEIPTDEHDILMDKIISE